MIPSHSPSIFCLCACWVYISLVLSDMEQKRYLSKAPNHLLHVEALLETFPDAQLIFTHRPLSVIVPSCLSLVVRLCESFGGTYNLKMKKRQVMQKSREGGWKRTCFLICLCFCSLTQVWLFSTFPQDCGSPESNADFCGKNHGEAWEERRQKHNVQFSLQRPHVRYLVPKWFIQCIKQKHVWKNNSQKGQFFTKMFLFQSYRISQILNKARILRNIYI